VKANAASPTAEPSAASAALFVKVVSSRYEKAFWSVLITSNNDITALGSLRADSRIPVCRKTSGG